MQHNNSPNDVTNGTCLCTISAPKLAALSLYIAMAQTSCEKNIIGFVCQYGRHFSRLQQNGVCTS